MLCLQYTARSKSCFDTRVTKECDALIHWFEWLWKSVMGLNLLHSVMCYLLHHAKLFQHRRTEEESYMLHPAQKINHFREGNVAGSKRSTD